MVPDLGERVEQVTHLDTAVDGGVNVHRAPPRRAADVPATTPGCRS